MSKNTDNDKERALERLRQSLLMGRFAGVIEQLEVEAYRKGMTAAQLGYNSVQNPYADSNLRWHWLEGFSTANNMKWPTKGAREWRNRPEAGKIV